MWASSKHNLGWLAINREIQKVEEERDTEISCNCFTIVLDNPGQNNVGVVLVGVNGSN
jgi:hypothetical protein